MNDFNRTHLRCFWSVVFLCFLTGFLCSAQAADAKVPGLEERLAKLEAAAASPINNGDNAWMLVSAAWWRV